ncbi:MAG: sigma-70 family RNA polymerase sigma factor [Verrucomicrobiales bacterium]|nr:sigma-70 family RNA polymerase sigma factor [Verrucomicrobiales bacterium]
MLSSSATESRRSRTSFNMSPEDQIEKRLPAAREFRTTHWSVVLEAGRGDSPQAKEALEQLCRNYWYPVYAFVRRWGEDPEDAQDMVQGFFARLLEKNYLAAADASKGRFRTFLLAAVKHYLCDEAKHARAQKRGGGREIISLDEHDAEDRYRLEPTDHCTPEMLFERRWARALLNLVLDRLEAEFDGSGKVERFRHLKPFLIQEQSASYRETADRLGLTESAVKSAINRLRERFRELVRIEIDHTVVNTDDIEDEIRHLFRLFSAP